MVMIGGEMRPNGEARSKPAKGCNMWYAVWTRTGSELLLADELRELIPEEILKRCFVPLRRIQKKYRGQWIEEDKSLFPGYLLIETGDIENVFFYLKNSVHIHKILKTGETFTPISAEEMKIIHKLLGDGDTVGLSTGIIVGGKALVIEGPMQGLEGYISKVDRHKRKAYLTIDLLGRCMEICMGLEVIDSTKS